MAKLGDTFQTGTGLMDEELLALVSDVGRLPELMRILRDKYGQSSAQQTAILRCVFGNPWKPAAVNPSWLTWNGRTVHNIAAGIYESRRFEDLPILADALEEAGCANEDILNHLRNIKRCVACNGEGSYDADNVATERVRKMTCRVCHGEKVVKDDSPHCRGCFVLDLLLEKE